MSSQWSFHWSIVEYGFILLLNNQFIFYFLSQFVHYSFIYFFPGHLLIQPPTNNALESGKII